MDIYKFVNNLGLYKISEFLWDLKNRCYAFKHGHRKVATWDINDWFLENIIVLLTGMIECEGLSCPMEFCGEWNPDKNDYDEPNYENTDGFTSWKELLIKMRDGFKQYNDVCENLEGIDECYQRHGFESFTKAVYHHDEVNYNAAMDEWRNIEAEAIKARDESMKLFSKWVWNLWN